MISKEPGFVEKVRINQNLDAKSSLGTGVFASTRARSPHCGFTAMPSCDKLLEYSTNYFPESSSGEFLTSVQKLTQMRSLSTKATTFETSLPRADPSATTNRCLAHDVFCVNRTNIGPERTGSRTHILRPDPRTEVVLRPMSAVHRDGC